MIEVEIVGVRIELPSNQPLVLLKEIHGERHVPIWIGTPEASAIALAQQGVVPPRPMTHDLLVDVVEALGHSIVSVNIVAVEDNIFYGQLQFDERDHRELAGLGCAGAGAAGQVPDLVRRLRDGRGRRPDHRTRRG